MQKETKEFLCTACISFLSGVVITLIIFGCATRMARLHQKPPRCPYTQQMNAFKHHNKLMGRKPVPVVILPQPQPKVPPKAPTTP